MNESSLYKFGISLILNQGKMHSFIHYVHIRSVLHLDIEHIGLIKDFD